MDRNLSRPFTQPSSYFMVATQERLKMQAESVTLDDTLNVFVANLCQHHITGAQMDQEYTS